MAPRTVRSAHERGSYATRISLGWVTKILLYRVHPHFARHFKPLVPAVFAVLSTHQSALGPRGGSWPVLFVGNP
jgi:hypothetical protein